VFKGLAQPSGYTEPLLHAWRLKVKAAAWAFFCSWFRSCLRTTGEACRLFCIY